VSQIAEFLDIEGDRVLLDIYTYRGVKISEYSVYPNESEIILLPGTVLKVVAQLDVGNGLTVIQMKEIPSLDEIKDTLLNDADAINFWTKQAKQRFEIPLEEFCEAILTINGLPIVKALSQLLDSNHIEAYQKFWGLWVYSGGEINFLKECTKVDPIKERNHSECVISLQRFGLLLIWFGHFTTFMNELFNSCQRGIIYDDSFTSEYSGSLLFHNSEKQKDLWLVRCSPKKETPFVLTCLNSNNESKVLHHRIYFNNSTRQYLFPLSKENSIPGAPSKAIVSDSINRLVDLIQAENQLGQGLQNAKIRFIQKPVQNFSHYDGVIIDIRTFSSPDFSLKNPV